MDRNEYQEILNSYDKKVKILEKKLSRSEENRLHTHEMKDKSQLFLTRLKNEIDEATAIIKKRNKELKELQEQAEASARIKSDFLANMSHEIRTPMNAIIGFTNLIYKTQLSPKQEDYVNKIGNSANALLHIINDILDFSKIDAGKLRLEKIKFNLEEVLDNLTGMISLKAYNKGLELIIMQDPQIPAILEGDPLRLGQILLNLADNAIKFTGKGEIFIRVSIESKVGNDITLLFEVEDMGIGLTIDQKANIFQAFSQADTSTTRKYGGTGLGLVISKQLVGLMGGKIDVTSEHGKGSTFFFTSKFRVVSDDLYERNVLPSGLKDIRILIIEDNKSTCEVLEMYLRNFGFDNVESLDKYSALKALNEGKHADLIFVDGSISDNESIKTIKLIREFMLHGKMPKLIMLTCCARENLIFQAKNEGFNVVLMKPVTQSVLFDTIVSLFIKKSVADEPLKRKRSLVKSEWEISGIRVLLAEDNDINQQVACELLEDEGVLVRTVQNGLEAFNILKDEQENFDVVLMDLHMPVLDGYKASRKIKQEIKGFKLPIIALTADAMSETREKVLNWDMDGYLTKPLMPDELYEMLHNWVRQKASANTEFIKLEEFMGAENTVKISSDAIFASRIDTETSLNRLRGNVRLYYKVLDKFLTHRNICSEFENMDEGNIESKIRTAHTMKGLSGEVGAYELQRSFEGLEKLLRKNMYTSKDFLTLADVTSKMLFSVCDEIEKILSANIAVEEREEEIVLHPENFDTNLKFFITMLEENDSRAKKTYEEIAPLLNAKLTFEDIDKVSKFISRYDFEEAGSLLKEKFML